MGRADYSLTENGLGQNGFGPGYLGEYSVTAALNFEAVATFFFTVILGATGPGAAEGFAGLAIGMTLAANHLVGINVTGVSVNSARSFGPALLVGGTALSQLWVFVLAGALHRARPFAFPYAAVRQFLAATARSVIVTRLEKG